MRALAAALLVAAAPACSRRAGLELSLTAVKGGVETPVDEVIPASADELRISGKVAERCRLFVFTIDGTGRVWRMPSRAVDAPGDLVQPGEFRLAGGYALEPIRPTVRFFAACGPEQLRFRWLVDSVRAGIDVNGGGDRGVERTVDVPALPDGTQVWTRLYRYGS